VSAFLFFPAPTFVIGPSLHTVQISAVTVAELLQTLIRIPSVNPDNDPGTPHTGEAALADHLAGFVRSLGASVDLVEVRPGRPNLIARFAPLDGRPRILLGPHLDTVGVGGMSIDPFAAEIRNGRIYGRGASDTKGPMAAMLWGLRENAAALRDAPVAIDFVAFMAEESCQHGSRHFAARHAGEYEFAIVGEPTSLDVVHTTKGSLWATLRATGKAAHSSQPERGENAILKLARSLVAIHSPLTDKLATFTHPVLGISTCNVGTIRGGSRPNIVPDLATAEIDIRTTPTLHQAGGALPVLRDFLDPHPIEIVEADEKPPMETPADHPWIQRIREIRQSSRCVGAPWFSDAAHLSHAGIPSVCLGPGSIDQAHTADEFIEIQALEQGAGFFADLIRSFCTPRP